MSGSNPADDMLENQNTPFGGFASAKHSFFNSINSNSRPGVPSPDTTFPEAFTNINNSNTKKVIQVFKYVRTSSNPSTPQPIFSFGPPPSNSSGPRFGDSTRTLTSSSSPSLFADVAKPSFGDSARMTSSSPAPSLFGDGTKHLFGDSTKTTSPSSSTPSLFANGTKPFQFNNPFNSMSTPSSLIHVCYNCGYKSSWGQHWGSKVATYTPTLDDEFSFGSSYILSISAMPFYKDKSHEELRFEDYRFQGKKQKLDNAPLHESATFGETLNNVPVNYESASAPLGQPMSTLPVLMLPVALLPSTAIFPP